MNTIIKGIGRRGHTAHMSLFGNRRYRTIDPFPIPTISLSATDLQVDFEGNKMAS
jgi:hypothetical protein